MEVSRTPTTAAMLLMLLVHITQGFPRESNANSLLNETKSSPPPGVSPPMIEARGMVPNDGELWPLWLGERYVAYRYADDQVDKSAIAAGIGELEANTCLKFDNVASWHWGHHIIIKHHNTLCTALVGRKLRNMFGQEMLLSSDCTNDPATVLHFLGHGVGMHHEHTRPDRDGYVSVLNANVRPDKLVKNFRKINSRTYNVPYDFTSVLHYSPFEYSSNGATTLRAVDPYNQGLMLAPKTGLSFMDKLLINKAYKCIDRWLAKCNRDEEVCENDGYTGKDCACICPPGTSGSTCATRTAPYTDALRRSLLPLNEQVTAAGTVTSPNHPTPNPDGTVFIKAFNIPGTVFTKVIEAPVCQRVKLTFTAFEMASRCDDKTCCNEGIEIQEAPPTAPSTTDTGEWFCGEEVTSGQIFESAGSKLILLYFIKENPSNSNPGFSATIAFETIPNCVG
ncbi:Peptidase M12A [Trinorchestia longiramus]|nr:Peptidase M12A [Trinorchestia longiramus]